MTIRITKTKLAIAFLALAVLVPTAAIGSDAWSDVEDGRFYHDAVTWAKANGMTTGCDGGTNFCPDRGVSRGENITFAKRYDDLVVQPALDGLQSDIDANASDIADNTADIADNADDIDGLPILLWGVVEGDGTFVRGSDGGSSTRLSAGRYEVDFGTDLTGCGYVATPGDPSTGSETNRAATTASRAGNANAVYVDTTDFSDLNTDTAFHIMVTCPPDSGLIIIELGEGAPDTQQGLAPE